jgi:nucleoside triphosphate diphosphatase
MTAIETLLKVMQTLRDPDGGCPWDLRQTSASIAPYTLDETHELLDAIERKDIDNIREELGDLLFNVVFHARIAEERDQFDFDDVAQGIADKMIRRHPHVFGDKADRNISEEALSQQWQALKQQEKAGANDSQRAPGESSLPAIYRARQLQKDAAKLGFDWPGIGPVLDKLEEEIAELREAVAEGDRTAMKDELGDVLFVCVNIARHFKVDAEFALRDTNRKFERRFAYVREQMTAAGTPMEAEQLERMESFWQEAKSVVG